jgi:hypothetical protein
VARADVTLAGNRALPRLGLAGLLQTFAIERHLRLQRGQGGKIGDQPGIAEPRGTFDRVVDNGSHPDRRAASLSRLEAYAQILDREYLAAEIDLVPCPQLSHQMDALGHALDALLQRHIEDLELVIPIAEADAEHV